MATKLNKPFEFKFPLKNKVVRNLKIVTETVGDLIVEGTAYFDPSFSILDIDDRYSADIDFVKWNGADIKPVLEVTGAMDDIEEAALRFIADGLFDSPKPHSELFEQACDIVSSHAKVFYGIDLQKGGAQ
jgi:hypothetical protein